MKWLQDLSEIYGDNLNNVRYEVNKRFRNKNKEYLQDRIHEPAMDI
jgi:hypothetical protein